MSERLRRTPSVPLLKTFKLQHATQSWRVFGGMSIVIVIEVIQALFAPLALILSDQVVYSLFE